VFSLVIVAAAPHLTVSLILLLVGLVIALLGHMTGSRLLILTGILIVGMVSAYFLIEGESTTFH
jgi:hypothetical protein